MNFFTQISAENLLQSTAVAFSEGKF